MKTRKRHHRYRLRKTRGAGKRSRTNRNVFLNIDTNNDTLGMGNILRPTSKRMIQDVYVASGSRLDTDDFHKNGIVPFLHECHYVNHTVGKGSQAISHVIRHIRYGLFLLRVVVSSSMKDIENEIKLYKRIHEMPGHETYVSNLLYADVPKIDHGIGISYFLFEYKKGQTLEDFFAKKPSLTMDAAQQMIEHMIQCVSFLHSIDIIHRDIKPANFYLPEGSQTPIVFDFGVSCISNISCTSYEFVGSRDYAHPSAVEAFRTPGTPYTFDVDYDMYAIRRIGTKDILPLLSDPHPWIMWLEEKIPSIPIE